MDIRMNKISVDSREPKKAIRRWHTLLGRRVADLKDIEKMPAAEAKLRLSHIIDIVVLGWNVRRDIQTDDHLVATAPHSPTLLERELEALITRPPEVPPTETRTGGEESPWWARSNRFQIFDNYVRAAIQEACRKRGLTLPAKTASDERYLQLLIQMAEVKHTTLSKLRKLFFPQRPKGHVTNLTTIFAAQVLHVCNPKSDLEREDQRRGGLSNLLAMLEAKLGLL